MGASQRRHAAIRRQLDDLCSDLDRWATELAPARAALPPSPPAGTAPARRRPRLWPRRLTTIAGVALIVNGLWFAARPVIGLVERSRTDQSALAQWRRGGSRALSGTAPVTAVDRPNAQGATSCGGGSPVDSYALVRFPSLAQYGYAGVAGDGGWDLLLQRSMVHFHGSAAPGESGNVIVGFHREPDYPHIDLLGLGDTVLVQDRDCRVWRYAIRRRSVLAPDRVTQLGATPDAELTLITCDPWFLDTRRIVWQATLVGMLPGA